MVRTIGFFEATIGPIPGRTKRWESSKSAPRNGAPDDQRLWNNYKSAPEGFDWLMNHEFSHEWFGNQLTNADWDDMWLHEGFGSYTAAGDLGMARWPDGLRRSDVQTAPDHRQQISNRLGPSPDRGTGLRQQDRARERHLRQGKLGVAHPPQPRSATKPSGARFAARFTAGRIRSLAISSRASARPTNSRRSPARNRTAISNGSSTFI